MTKTYLSDAGPVIDAIPEPSEQLHTQAKRLADRLGLAHPAYGRVDRLLVPALHKILDRIEAMEKSELDDHR